MKFQVSVKKCSLGQYMSMKVSYIRANRMNGYARMRISENGEREIRET